MKDKALQRDRRPPLAFALETQAKDAVGVDIGVEERRDALERWRRLQRVCPGELEEDAVPVAYRQHLINVSATVEVQVEGLVGLGALRDYFKLDAATGVELPLQAHQLLVVVVEPLVSKRCQLCWALP